MKFVSLRDLLIWKKSVGPQSIHFFGLMGSGKSNFAYGLVNKALTHHGEFAIMPGDRMCEWRHFLVHDKFKKAGFGVNLIIPEDVDIHYYGFRPSAVSDTIIRADFNKLNILEHLTPEKPLAVVYEQHLKLSDRATLWARLLKQTTNRTTKVGTCYNFLFHEAGVLFPESARGKHWRAVKDFGEIFVETRKSYVRCWIISQLEKEIEHNIRRKCSWQVIMRSMLQGGYDKPLRDRTKFLKLGEYCLVNGGLYGRWQTMKKTPEHPDIWKMIPKTTDVVLETSKAAEKEAKNEILDVIKNEKLQLNNDWHEIADRVRVETGEDISPDACRKRFSRYLKSV